MENTTIGVALCGSFCTFSAVFSALRALKETYPNLIPIVSPAVCSVDSRFGTAEENLKTIESLCGHPVLRTLSEVEPIGPKKLLDLLLIAPCTGNTLAKLANGIADTPVTLAAKSHLRNNRPIVLGVSTNDALGAGAQNIGKLLARKNIYFVPFGQDDPKGKPCSMVADLSYLQETIQLALQGKQIQPILLAK